VAPYGVGVTSRRRVVRKLWTTCDDDAEKVDERMFDVEQAPRSAEPRAHAVRAPDRRRSPDVLVTVTFSSPTPPIVPETAAVVVPPYATVAVHFPRAAALHLAAGPGSVSRHTGPRAPGIHHPGARSRRRRCTSARTDD